MGLGSGQLLVLDSAIGEQLNPFTKMGPGVAVNPDDGTLLLSPGYSYQIEQRLPVTLGDGRIKDPLQGSDEWSTERVNISSDGSTAAGDQAFFDPRTLELLSEFPTKLTTVWDLAALDNGLWLILGHDERNKDTLLIVEAESGAVKAKIPVRNSAYRSVVVGSSGHDLFLAASYSTVRIDLSLSRAPFPWYWVLSGFLGLLIALSLILAATAPRWVPTMRSRSEARHVRSAEKIRGQMEVQRTRQAAAQQNPEAKEQRREDTGQAVLERAHAQRVQAIQDWQRVYADANNGKLPPPGYIPPVFAALVAGYGAAPYQQRTNILAILALAFGLGGGVLGVILGHIALSQIKRTGERSRARNHRHGVRVLRHRRIDRVDCLSTGRL